jgi:predicted RNA binding protein with dsRBD fold (UPF0201 family)
MPLRVEVTVEAEVHPTEDVEKVKSAILNIFPTIPLEVENRGERVYIAGVGAGIAALEEFCHRISRERISDSARRILRTNILDQRIVVCLNKQVATVGQVSFCELQGESPLGPIIVAMKSDRLDEVIDILAPKTLSRQSARGTSRTMKSSAKTTFGKMSRARSRKSPSSA